MKAIEIRKMTSDELVQKVENLQQEIFNLRFQKEAGQMENPNKIRLLKRDISRCLTIIQELKHNA
ncbi:MAG: 50S ribosomal protein L29 [Desulfatirhabdiaceae bacterium]|jgi:large subunit ribosomal protein L29